MNTGTAPDGTTTAATVTANSGSSDTWAGDSVSNPSLYDGQTVTTSVYLRVPSGTLNTYLYIINVGDAGWGVAGVLPITITTNWQRFSVTGTNQNGLTELVMQIAGASTFTSGQSFQVWGAQMVVGTDPAPYTPTIGGTTGIATGQPVTLVQNGLNETYSYDSFGNLQQNGGFNDSFTANNQMFGYAYDAAGNLLSNGLTTMTWDAGSKLTSTGGATYIYDAEGNRVEKQGVGVTDTIYFGGRPIARLTGGQWTDLIYGPTGLLAEVAGNENAQPEYRLLDHLGTQVGTAGSNGLLTNPLDYSPFGQVFSGSTNDPYMFTGKERDTESGLDFFGRRYYGSSAGRFMSPDPHNPILIRQGSIAGGLPEEAANSSFLGFLDNPQNWNQYAYVRNNPLGFTDPTGGFPAQADGHHLLVERGNISNPLARDFANSIKTGGPNPASNVWSNASGHPAYNNAVNEIQQGLEQTEGDSNGWSLSQWKDFANKVLNSDEPAIKDFLDQIEVELPGSRAKLAAAIASYQPSKFLLARIAAGLVTTRLQNALGDFFICFTCSIEAQKERVTHRLIYDTRNP